MEPLSAGTLGSPACAAAQSCRSPAASRWFFQPGLDGGRLSVGTAAHLCITTNGKMKTWHLKWYGWNEVSCTEKLFLIHQWSCSQHGGSEGFLALDVHRWLQHRSRNLKRWFVVEKQLITWDFSSLRLNPMFQEPVVESLVRERRQRAGRFSLQRSICTGRFWEYRECQCALWQSESRCCLKHKTDSSTWTTERGHHGSGLYSSSGRSWRYWAPEWKLAGPRRWEWIHVWARKQSCKGLKNTIEPFWERGPFPALIVLV